MQTSTTILLQPPVHTPKSLQKFRCIQFLCQWKGCKCVSRQCSSFWFVLNTSQSLPLTKLSATCLQPWVGVENNSKVLCAHCTCKAGLSEACSHVIALLFAVDMNTNENISVMHLNALQLATTFSSCALRRDLRHQLLYT